MDKIATALEQGSADRRRPFSLPLYLLIVAALSWPFQIAYAALNPDPFWSYLLSSVSMVMVTVGSFIAGRYVFRDGFKGAGWSWGKPLHYALVFLLALFIFALPAALEHALGLRGLPEGGLPILGILGGFGLRFLATLIPGFGEEFGWRGYMLPRLVERFGQRKGLLLHGLIWWAWHIPVIVGMGIHTGDIEGPAGARIAFMLGVTLIPSVMNAILFAYVWSRSGSLAVASVYHSAYDEVRDAIEKTVGFGALVPLWEMAATTLLGLWALWKGKWGPPLRSSS